MQKNNPINISTLLLSFFALLVFSVPAKAQQLVTIKNTIEKITGNQIEIFEDTSKKLEPLQAFTSRLYKLSEKEIPSYYENNSVHWLHCRITNESNSNLLMNIDYPILNQVDFYQVKRDSVINFVQDGFDKSYSTKKYQYQSFLFDLNLPKGDTCDYFIRVSSNTPFLLPISVGNKESVFYDANKPDIISGVYFGIMIALFLYNIFIFFSVKDRSYIYYVVYVIFMGLTQLALKGYCRRFLFEETPLVNGFTVIIFPCIAGITSINFGRAFLETKTISKKIDFGFNFFSYIYLAAILLVLTGFYALSYRIIDINVFLLVVYAFTVFSILAKRGKREARFLLISWTMLFIAIIIFILSNSGLLPYNGYTKYILYIGSALQAILLSIALADRINIYKKEKEKSQEDVLKASQENERLVREQNIVLEQKVTERTTELQAANGQLNNALSNLKEAQTQLVEAEKMASLGQLTAGIAHEINNPINFVKSNIKPLRLDVIDIFKIIDQYNQLHTSNITNIPVQLQTIDEAQKQINLDFIKSEIEHLIKGIEDGAERTAEIVRGLRVFSRLDESELKTANVHDGIDSTLVLLKNTMPHYVNILKDFKANASIECYPGKLNQVFMNILNNAIQAIKSKKIAHPNETITISTTDTDDKKIRISIKDTGTGMTEEVKHRIFEPFFTTKDVGEGTGLGMAIVFKIIEEHAGKIEVKSEPDKGAEFIITLPYIHSN